MFTSKDLEMRTIFVVNCIEHNRSLRVSNGELMLEEIDGDRKKTLTKIPFQKMLALFVVGHITVTTPPYREVQTAWCGPCGDETQFAPSVLLGECSRGQLSAP